MCVAKKKEESKQKAELRILFHLNKKMDIDYYRSSSCVTWQKDAGVRVCGRGERATALTVSTQSAPDLTIVNWYRRQHKGGNWSLQRKI